jgi:hypothetical protein
MHVICSHSVSSYMQDIAIGLMMEAASTSEQSADFYQIT